MNRIKYIKLIRVLDKYGFEKITKTHYILKKIDKKDVIIFELYLNYTPYHYAVNIDCGVNYIHNGLYESKLDQDLESFINTFLLIYH